MDDQSIDDIPAEMSASYSEISKSNNTAPPIRPASLGYATFPYNLEGTISIDGNMTHYVTENLEYKIKLSSPNTKLDFSLPNSRQSTPSTSLMQPSNIGRSFHQLHQNQTNQIGQIGQFGQYSQCHIDINVLNDVEIEAQYLAASVDNLTENLCNLLHSISSITADNVETYKNAVNKLTDCMDGNIKSMYTIMAKTEEISNAMRPTEELAVKIREIKGLVDMLDNVL